jgi:hypothetical protein
MAPERFQRNGTIRKLVRVDTKKRSGHSRPEPDTSSAHARRQVESLLRNHRTDDIQTVRFRVHDIDATIGTYRILRNGIMCGQKPNALDPARDSAGGALFPIRH